ncbi:putative methyltransferase [Candidatus Terasakiella magnetica]|nr:putative methyltransferase [Candidatus Terasakiella magnetica]
MTSDGTLHQHRAVWDDKPVLRLLYRDFYRRLAGACVPGLTLEVGGGTGRLREYLPQVVSSDIQWAPWLDVVADAQSLPFADASFDNIVLMDVLHHIERPMAFLAEASRVLRPGGRLVVLEPGITALSFPFYRWLHQEDVRMGVDPFDGAPVCDGGNPYDSNQAIPTLMLARSGDRLQRSFPRLSLRSLEWLSLFAYPLSGGFKRWSLIPAALVAPLLWLEDRLAPLIGRFAAFRLLAVLEKT